MGSSDEVASGDSDDADQPRRSDPTSADPPSQLPDNLSSGGSQANGASPDDSSSFGRFLYNHNPFYLLSCLLVIYGCQDLAVSSGSLSEKSLSMGGGIAAYTLLMACVCIGVVRLAKIWEDARSIFIVVVISLVAVTTSFDELCMRDAVLSARVALATLALVALVTETVLALCRVRLSFWYRLSYYAIFLTLIGFPLILGRAVAERNDQLANWGSVLFSIVAALCLLLLIPAMRRGSDSIRGNGTPWPWPLYPLSAFIVLAVLLGIRSHALWISFGFFGTAGRLEPFLLLPLFAAALLILVESSLAFGNRKLQRWAITLAPFLVLCGMTESGMTRLPIRSDLQMWFGSAQTVALITVLGLYLWMSFRGLRSASLAIPGVLMACGWMADLPSYATEAGIDRWIFPALASVVLMWMALRMTPRDWILTGAGAAATFATAYAGQSLGYRDQGLIAAATVATVSMLFIGACFSTDLALVLRCAAAAVMCAGVIVLLIRSSHADHAYEIYPVLVLAMVAAGYAFVVHRSGWLFIAAAQILLFLAGIAFQNQRSGSFRRVNWPIASGLACLVVGVTITAGKTGVYRRIGGKNRVGQGLRFRSGL